MSHLTDREQLLVDAYFRNGCANKALALKEAGFSHHHAIFQKQSIRREIEGRQAFLARKQNITEERILKELSALAFQRPGELLVVQDDGSAYMDFRELTEDQRAAIESIKVEEYMEGKGEEARAVKRTQVKFACKQAALESLMKFLGMSKKKEDISTDGLVEKLLAAKKRVRVEITDAV